MRTGAPESVRAQGAAPGGWGQQSFRVRERNQAAAGHTAPRVPQTQPEAFDLLWPERRDPGDRGVFIQTLEGSCHSSGLN